MELESCTQDSGTVANEQSQLDLPCLPPMALGQATRQTRALLVQAIEEHGNDLGPGGRTRPRNSFRLGQRTIQPLPDPKYVPACTTSQRVNRSRDWVPRLKSHFLTSASSSNQPAPQRDLCPALLFSTPVESHPLDEELSMQTASEIAAALLIQTLVDHHLQLQAEIRQDQPEAKTPA